MVGPSQQLIYMVCVRARRCIAAQNRKIGGYLSIEQSEFLQLRARKSPQSALIGLSEQRCKPVPVGPPLCNPLIG